MFFTTAKSPAQLWPVSEFNEIQRHLTLLGTVVSQSYPVGRTFPRGKTWRKRVGFSGTQRDFNYTRYKKPIKEWEASKSVGWKENGWEVGRQKRRSFERNKKKKQRKERKVEREKKRQRCICESR